MQKIQPTKPLKTQQNFQQVIKQTVLKRMKKRKGKKEKETLDLKLGKRKNERERKEEGYEFWERGREGKDKSAMK